MKKSRFSDSQIMAILKQAEQSTPVAELCREHGHEPCLVLQMTRKVRRHGRLNDEAAQGTGGRKPSVKEDVC